MAAAKSYGKGKSQSGNCAKPGVMLGVRVIVSSVRGLGKGK